MISRVATWLAPRASDRGEAVRGSSRALTVRLRHGLAGFTMGVASALASASAAAQTTTELPTRDARFFWDTPARRLLLVSVSYRDALDETIRRKLKRGLPTTLVMTATLFATGREPPLATTAQTCRVTWHVWEEAYRIELTRPGAKRPVTWSPSMEGVLRRCAEAGRLLAGTGAQVPAGSAVYMRASVQINPVSDEVLSRIQRWVSRPTGTGTAAPGDALFSTFTGLFLQRVGRAERLLTFDTRAVIPSTPTPAAK